MQYVQMFNAGYGLINSMNQKPPSALEGMSTAADVGTPLNTTASKDVFNLLDRYKQGKENYKSFLKKDSYGSINRIANADVQNKATANMSKILGAGNPSNMNMLNNAISNYTGNTTKSAFQTSTKEAQMNMSNLSRLRANRFNQLRFVNAIDDATTAQKQFSKSFKDTVEADRIDAAKG